MRDINRIDKVLNELKDIWMANPDQRFGQLMSNIFGEIMYKNGVGDIFFPEDNEWFKWLQEYKNEHSIYNYGQNLKFDIEVDDGK